MHFALCTHSHFARMRTNIVHACTHTLFTHARTHTLTCTHAVSKCGVGLLTYNIAKTKTKFLDAYLGETEVPPMVPI